MIPKLAVLLGLSFCALLPFVVGASVSQNDDVSTFADVIKSRSARSTCGYDSCNRFCRSLGHARGVCIGNLCQCRSRRRRAADDSQDLENVRVDEVKTSESGPQANDEAPSKSDYDVSTFADVIKSRSARSTCGYDSCNRFCRSLGHARGVCIGNLCQCRSRRRRAADDSQDLENVRVDEVKTSESGTQANDEAPSNSNYDVSPFADVIKSRSVRSTCGYDSCNRFCRSLGHARGVCIGTYCQCRFRRRRAADDAQDLANDTSIKRTTDVIKSRSVRATCGTDEECTKFCRFHKRLEGKAHGVCIGSCCQCRFRSSRSAALEKMTLEIAKEKTADTENEPAPIHSEVSSGTFADVILSRSRRSCGADECNAHCKKLGHARGVCIGTYCQCRSRLRRSLDDTDGTGKFTFQHQ